jgi:hypothetical protein
MTALISGRFLLAFYPAAFLLAGLSAKPAHSQDEAGQVPAAPPPRPLQLLPEQLAEPEDTLSEPEDISVGALEAPSLDRIGLIDTLGGGFSDTLWRDSDLETLQKILPQIPERILSPAQRILAKRLLLSSGAPPTTLTGALQSLGPVSAAPNATSSQWLLETRVTRLAAMGAWDDALAMIELVPLADMTETIRRLRVDAYLVLNRLGDACSDIQAALNRAPDTHWQKMQVFCHVVNGQTSAADLGLSLLREQQIDDAAFFWAAEFARGINSEPPVSMETPAPLILAMLRIANTPIPDAVIRWGDAMTFGLLAELPLATEDANGDEKSSDEEEELRRAAAEARLLLAEEAVELGTFRADDLRVLYRDLIIDTAAEPSLDEISPADVRGRVRLFQSALAHTVPTARAEVIARALEIVRIDMGGTGPSLATLGMVYAPLLRGIRPSADMVWFSGSAARGLLAAGEFDAARDWLNLAKSMARSSQEASQIADNLWPLERLLTVGAKARLPAGAMDAWAATVPEGAVNHGREILLNLFAAFGDPVTTADWQPVLNGSRTMERGPAVAPHIWNGLTLSARDRRVGEAAAFALIALGDEGPAFAAPHTLAKVIATLMAIGREQDARALAIEAALALGL